MNFGVSLIIVFLFLSSCSLQGGRYKDPTDNQMYSLLESAAKAFGQKKFDESVSLYKQCIALKPDPGAFKVSQPRRWCQNNLVNIMLECNTPACDKNEALRLAKELVKYQRKEFDVAYNGSLARAYAGVGDFDSAVKEMERVVSLMAVDHKWRSSYERQLKQYKEKLNSPK